LKNNKYNSYSRKEIIENKAKIARKGTIFWILRKKFKKEMNSRKRKEILEGKEEILEEKTKNLQGRRAFIF